MGLVGKSGFGTFLKMTAGVVDLPRGTRVMVPIFRFSADS